MSRALGKDYRRVKVDREDKEKGQGPENEIKVTAKGGQRSYITYAIALLNGEDGKTKYDTIKVSGMGVAIYNAVNIAEIVKRRVKGVHQITEISSQVVQDSYESVDKEKKNVEVERKVSTILVTLSTKQLDKKHVGYQAPLPDDQVTEQEDRPRPARREPREPRAPRAEGAAAAADAGEAKPEGAAARGGRGRGRGSRGSRGRGGSRGGRGEGRGGRGSGEGRGRGSGEGRGRGGEGRGRGSGEGRGRGTGRGGADRREDRTAADAPRGAGRGGRGKN